MPGDLGQMRQAAASIGASIKEQASAKMEGMVGELLKKGASVKDLFGLGDAMVEGIYGQAYRLYNTGKYRDACQLFRLLIMLDAMEPKYRMGMAACFHMLKEFKNAVDTYAFCGVLDPANPIPHFHASDCYIQMGSALSALVSLEMAVKRAEGKPQFATLRDRALMTIESLRREIEVNKGGGSGGTP